MMGMYQWWVGEREEGQREGRKGKGSRNSNDSNNTDLLATHHCLLILHSAITKLTPPYSSSSALGGFSLSICPLPSSISTLVFSLLLSLFGDGACEYNHQTNELTFPNRSQQDIAQMLITAHQHLHLHFSLSLSPSFLHLLPLLPHRYSLRHLLLDTEHLRFFPSPSHPPPLPCPLSRNECVLLRRNHRRREDDGREGRGYWERVFYGEGGWHIAVQEVMDAEHAAVGHQGCEWYSDEVEKFKVSESESDEDEGQKEQPQNTNSNSNKPQKKKKKNHKKKKKKKGNKFVTEVDDYAYGDTLFATGYE